MKLSNNSLMYKIITTIVLAVFSVSAMAAAFSQTQILAYQGNADAQFNLGTMYIQGESVPQNAFKALEWFQKSADQGNADAQYHLGLMYYHGEGVPQDYAKTVEWY